MKLALELFEFPDGAVGLSCKADKLRGMEADLVFASGATRGDPILEKQRGILEEIVKVFNSSVNAGAATAPLTPATGSVYRAPDWSDPREWVIHALAAIIMLPVFVMGYAIFGFFQYLWNLKHSSSWHGSWRPKENSPPNAPF